jgi:hypothetical protein
MTPQRYCELHEKYGSIKAVARKCGEDYGVMRRLWLVCIDKGWLKKEGVGRKRNDTLKKTKPAGRVKAITTRSFERPTKGKVSRYILTCAQNNTKMHMPFWNNLLALAGHYKAGIHVARFLYIKSGLGATGDKATAISKELDDVVWDAAVVPYLSDERAEIAPGLVWCGEMNILPTAVRPLSGLEVYTGRRSGIFPHVKIAMDSIASARGEPTKFNYTTGTVTQRNYIQRKAGLKAEFHHGYGALLVEVDSDGDWFVRQLNADSTGTIHDLDVCVRAGKVTTGNRVEAITWGDIHVAEMDETIRELCFGEKNLGCMLDELRPKHQFLHDVLHFRGRSHHEIKDPHMMYRRFVKQQDAIAQEVRLTGDFISDTLRPWVKTVIVDSNHHHHLGRWLKEQDGRLDPLNAPFWFDMQQRVYAKIALGVQPNYLVEALKQVGVYPPTAKFLQEDESYVICSDEHGGIECGQHGDLGPNGSRGSALNFAKMGRRANIGHSHSARIADGVYQSGTCGELAPDWTHGPGSWSHSHIVVYPNGKRTIVTCWNGKWRAQ